MKSKFLWLGLLSLFILPAALQAQSPTKPGNAVQYVYRSWDNQSGLPQNTVNDLAKDADGYLWAATEEGLIRFDGSEFFIRNEANTPGLYSNTFYDLHAGRQELWASSRNTVLRLRKKELRAFDFRKHLGSAWIKCIEQDQQGRLWVGSSSGSLFYIENDSINTCPAWKWEDAGSIEVLKLASGGMMAGTTKGLFTLETKQGALTGQGKAIRDFNGMHITAMAVGKKTGLWIGTAGEGIFHLSTDTIHLTEQQGLKDAFINSLAIDGDGMLWIGTRSSGFQQYSNGLFSSPGQKLNGDGVKSILITEADLVWLGTTSSGLVQVKPAQVQVLPQHLGLSSTIMLPVYQHPNGEIWLGTAGKGASRLAGDKTTVFNKQNGLSSDLVLSVYGTEDYVYIGTANGLDRFNLRSQAIDRHYTKEDGLSNNSIQSLFQDSHKRLWATTRAGGLHQLKANGYFEKLGVPAALVNIGFLNAFESRDGRMFFGTRGAGMLAMATDGNFTHFNSAKGFPADVVYCFFEDKKGVLWMGTEKGLVAHANGRYRLFNTENGLRFNEIYRIMDDNTGHVWLSGNFGLQRVSLGHLQKALDDASYSRLPVRLFNTSDGMSNAEANGGIFPAGWKMQDGSLWFPTVQGIAIVNPLFIREDRSPLNIRLESIGYAGEEYFPYEKPQVPPGTHNIEIHYTSIDFSKATDINYYYRLKGLDDEWIPAGNRRTAYFSGLSPGSYEFEVKAEQYGSWSPTAALAFTVEPHFYQTIWFRALMLLLLVSTAAIMISRQRKGAKEKLLQQKEITKAQITGQERERQVIGAELHDNINQQLATAKLYLDFARSNEEMRLAMVEKSERVVHNVINDIRALCKSLIPPTLKDIGLVDALQELMSTYTIVDQFEVDFSCTAPLDDLVDDLRFSLFRITQEQMTNIVKHAGANHVWVDIRQGDKELLLTIKDNGRGFDARLRSRGLGLTGIRNRLELYNGEMEINTAPGMGCELRIAIPLDKAVFRTKAAAFRVLVSRKSRRTLK
ncbi:MAG TPA: two-component regulator propeller domain-containing protein [Flavisolibacter sp.]|nr:two-component regulator propeller domain-containing protein [Flavisolibacter sp.]